MTTKFRITHPWSGFVGIFEADDPDKALDAMARAMGYRDYLHAYRKGRIVAIELNIERVDVDGSTEKVWPHY